MTNKVEKTRVRESVFKTDEGWFFTKGTKTKGPFRTRELARGAKKVNNAIEVGANEKKVSTKKKKKSRKNKEYLTKVFYRNSEGILRSASIPENSQLSLEYREGKVTRVSRLLLSAGFGICCFDNEDNRRKWKHDGSMYDTSDSGFEVWKVEVGKVIEAAKRRPSVIDLAELLPKDHLSPKQMLEIIESNSIKAGWPTGIVMVEWVRPIERLV